jgi:hypothetical protein
VYETHSVIMARKIFQMHVTGFWEWAYNYFWFSLWSSGSDCLPARSGIQLFQRNLLPHTSQIFITVKT